jgi:hypothetical protein
MKAKIERINKIIDRELKREGLVRVYGPSNAPANLPDSFTTDLFRVQGQERAVLLVSVAEAA